MDKALCAWQLRTGVVACGVALAMAAAGQSRLSIRHCGQLQRTRVQYSSTSSTLRTVRCSSRPLAREPCSVSRARRSYPYQILQASILQYLQS
jgi:hypothetical protein